MQYESKQEESTRTPKYTLRYPQVSPQDTSFENGQVVVLRRSHRYDRDNRHDAGPTGTNLGRGGILIPTTKF